MIVLRINRVLREAAVFSLAHQRFEQRREWSLIHRMRTQVHRNVVDGLGSDLGITGGHDDFSATRDEIAGRINTLRARAHHFFNRGQRAISPADAAKLSVDHDRMRLFDDELTVIHIRLGHHRRRCPRLSKRATHAVVIEAGFIVDRCLDLDRVAVRPIAKGIGNESTCWLNPFLGIARGRSGIVAVGVGFIEHIRGSDVVVSLKRGVQQLHGQRALPKQGTLLLRGNTAGNLHRVKVGFFDVARRNQRLTHQLAIGDALEVFELLARSPKQNHANDDCRGQHAHEQEAYRKRRRERNRARRRGLSNHSRMVMQAHRVELNLFGDAIPAD